ncbi:hypothetical protein [Dyadobacter linearis]|uniref:hypothetical protein n=1 Tax=Dyadobacter linearis TaxID=2823330 RepID=UPI001BFC8828|nr:hypothetical protein [Dyadobacter sp. CECT 9623]
MGNCIESGRRAVRISSSLHRAGFQMKIGAFFVPERLKELPWKGSMWVTASRAAAARFESHSLCKSE